MWREMLDRETERRCRRRRRRRRRSRRTSPRSPRPAPSRSSASCEAAGVTDEGGHPRAALAGELDRHPPDAARRAGDKDALAEDAARAASSAHNAVSPAVGSVAACSSGTCSGMTASESVGTAANCAQAPARTSPDDAGTGRRPAAVGSGALDDAGEVPAGDRPRSVSAAGRVPRPGSVRTPLRRRGPRRFAAQALRPPRVRGTARSCVD